MNNELKVESPSHGYFWKTGQAGRKNNPCKSLKQEDIVYVLFTARRPSVDGAERGRGEANAT